jgi:mannose-6-phosphate isomerase-like protein (cupin superfamily)
MADRPYRAARIEDIPTQPQDYEPDADWKPVRRHFGIGSFGTNAYVGREAGCAVIMDHTETEDSGTRHEELYFVAHGHALFAVAGEEVDAPAGTFVYVPDPGVRRGAVAVEAGTTILCFGGEPGVAYSVSPWEREHFPAQ